MVLVTGLEVNEGVLGMVRLRCPCYSIQKKLYITVYFKVKLSSFFTFGEYSFKEYL